MHIVYLDINVQFQIEGNKGLQSMFMVLYYVCCKNATNRDYMMKCIEFLVKYIFTKQIVVRTAAQIVVCKLCERFDLIMPFESLYASIKTTHKSTVSKALRFSYAHEYRFHCIDPNHMLHSMYILREIPRVTKMSRHILMSDEYYHSEMFDPEDPKLVVDMDDPNYTDHSIEENVDVEVNFVENCEDTVIKAAQVNGNVQKKIVAYRETIIDRRILNSLPEDFLNKNMVSCATFSLLLFSLLYGSYYISHLLILERMCPNHRKTTAI